MATVELSFTPLPAHVRTARLVATAVARRSRVEESLLDEVRLAVGEACSRAVEAHRVHCPSEPIRIELSDRDGRFSVVVTDAVPTGHGERSPQRAGEHARAVPDTLAAKSEPAAAKSEPVDVASGAVPVGAMSGRATRARLGSGAPPSVGPSRVSAPSGGVSGPPVGAVGSGSAPRAAGTEGAATEGAATDRGTDGADVDGAATDGAATDGAAADGAVNGGILHDNGGLPADIGLAVIEGLADDVQISATDCGVSIRMSWPLAPGE